MQDSNSADVTAEASQLAQLMQHETKQILHPKLLASPSSRPRSIPEGDLNTGTYTRVHFRVRASTRFGEEVRCSGSSLIMGQYNPSESMPLVTSPETYPVWTTFKPVILPRGVPHRYMYAMFSGGEFSSWEEIECDRTIVPEGLEMTVEEDFGVYDESMKLEPIKPTNDQETKSDSFSSALSFATVFRRVEHKDLATPSSNELVQSSSQHFPLNKTSNLTNYKRIKSSSYRPIPESKMVIVCYHLPVHLTKDQKTDEWTVQWNQDSLIAKTEGSIAETMEVWWMGCITSESTRFYESLTEDDQEQITKVLKQINCVPVFVDSKILEAHYQGYCKSHLWPMFHNVDVLDIFSATWDNKQVEGWEQRGTGTWREAYMTVNRLLAEEAMRMTQPNDTIWVHDYHLCLFGKEIDNLCTEAGRSRPKMVFFLHVPFPTSEIFREISIGPELLEGILSVDVVGFHSFDHARHFLNACKRFLGLSYQSRSGGNLGVNFRGRNVVVTITHVGLEVDYITNGLNNPEVEKAAMALRKKHKGKILICGVDSYQRLSGVPLKLLAFEQLFNTCPVWQDKVVLVQRCTTVASRFGDQEYSKAEIRELVDRITSKYGPCIDFEEGRPLKLEQRLAIWKACDLLLHTAVRGGLNLKPLEYVYAKSDGTVLLSEFSGCCCILNGAIRINPWNLVEVTSSLDQALMMSKEERSARRARDLEYITKKPASSWTRQVLTVLQEATETEEEEYTELGQADTETGLSHLLRIGDTTDFAQLDPVKLLKAYKSTRHRVFLLDYGGTLLARENMSMYVKKDFRAVSGRAPSSRMMHALQLLAADKRNTVFVISGVSQVNLTNVFGHIKGLSLAAQNGAIVSWAEALKRSSTDGETQGAPELNALEALDNSDDREWYHHHVTYDWDKVRAVADPLLKAYRSRTNGSILQHMDQGIAWNYRSTDPEWGLMQANQLQSDLEEVLKDFPVTIIRKKGLLEIVPEGLHKGVVARKILKGEVGSHGHPDFIFCIGDDTTDESMFKSIYEYIAERSEESVHGGVLHTASTMPDGPRPQHVFTCTVGKKPSNAYLYVNEVSDVEDLLSTLGSESATEAQEAAAVFSGSI